MTGFWQKKSLAEMTRAEWESLCDGCGRCCLHKLRDEETGTIWWTNVSCRLLDTTACRCRDYKHRQARIPDCVQLSADNLGELDWLPPSCAYRRLSEGRPLAWWHPLVSGRPETVHEAGISVRGKTIDERHAGPLEEHLVDWPGRAPRGKRAA
jgi:uncharacterized cysteine cluster protein YcgN (CxxCxxCC family)